MSRSETKRELTGGGARRPLSGYGNDQLTDAPLTVTKEWNSLVLLGADILGVGGCENSLPLAAFKLYVPGSG
jgi:hypothetical protein